MPSKRRRILGHDPASGLAGQIWHYDKRRRNWKFNSDDVRPGPRDQDLRHWMSAGGIGGDGLRRDERKPYEDRARVIRWMVAFAIAWIALRFL